MTWSQIVTCIFHLYASYPLRRTLIWCRLIATYVSTCKWHDTGLLFEHSHSNKVHDNRLFQLESLPLNSGRSISWVGGSQGVFNV